MASPVLTTGAIARQVSFWTLTWMGDAATAVDHLLTPLRRKQFRPLGALRGLVGETVLFPLLRASPHVIVPIHESGHAPP